MSRKIYKKLSSIVYDFTKPVFSSIDNDLSFYKEKILPVNGKVLEIGCGNGRVLITLLKYGIDIEGLDFSKEMLEICDNNLKINNLSTKIYLQDVLFLKLDEKYENIIILNGSLNFIDTNNLSKVFSNLANVLKEDGLVYIDLIYPNVKENEKFIQNININNLDIKITNKNISNGKIIENLITYESNQDIEIENFKIYIHSESEIRQKIENSFLLEDIIINFGKENNNTLTKTFILKKISQ